MSATHDASPSSQLVLVVEDEPAIAEILLAYLKRDGLRAVHALSGEEALQMFARIRPDLVLLDIQLPGMDGIDVLNSVRAAGEVPVIMVTARAEDVDKLLSLRLGADDYVVKPFSPAEVVARVRAVLRRSARREEGARKELIRVGRLIVDMSAHCALVEDEQGNQLPLPLTLTEFRLLACMARQPRQCFSRSHLIETCLPESDAMDRVIDSHLSKLRRKLQQAGLGDLIETVRSIGYRLWPEA
ncbi:MAG: response regulator transcription factor [Methyloversatilis sp.]|jgi:two-component system response regulator AdeR|uniref:Two component transcriptional regulator, winged helix family n=1 Tax=Methyloversatilis universalis (strain ATCC BAA-1314 / DSM 25237 / JCM 13912 / CCUG 52030 / FAM5) TaxID=1000565 RepID=F5REY6_METUF|nr:response regulator [Methyloversatilis universalis]EGK71467.1 Two component transcriptional regulator, winged helix family [Methyloversatilis universalis FAM5]MCP4637973.1 response regulator transcription factor [Methyloversatilis sp.]